MKNSNIECVVTTGEFMGLVGAYNTTKIQMQRAKDARDLEKNPVYFLMRERFLFQWQGRLEALEFALRTMGYEWADDTDWQGDNDDWEADYDE